MGLNRFFNNFFGKNPQVNKISCKEIGSAYNKLKKSKYERLFRKNNITVKNSTFSDYIEIFVSDIKIIEIYDGDGARFYYKFPDEDVFNKVWDTVSEICKEIEKLEQREHEENVDKVITALNKNNG